MSERAGVTGEETEFLSLLRKIEKEWRRGFIGNMSLDVGPGGRAKLRIAENWKPGDDERRSNPA